MKYAKVVFWVAGIWGLLVVSPLFFMFGMIGRQDPPVITHPEFYFGFLGVTLVWQVVFLVIASDPPRYRPMMVLSVFEKASYILTVGVLFALGRMTASASALAVPDGILAVLFVVSFLKTRPLPQRLMNGDSRSTLEVSEQEWFGYSPANRPGRRDSKVQLAVFIRNLATIPHRKIPASVRIFRTCGWAGI
jgi:hypothetical protein